MRCLVTDLVEDVVTLELWFSSSKSSNETTVWHATARLQDCVDGMSRVDAKWYLDSCLKSHSSRVISAKVPMLNLI